MTYDSADGGKWFDSARSVPTDNRYIEISNPNCSIQVSSLPGGACLVIDPVHGGATHETPEPFNYFDGVGGLPLGFTVAQWVWPHGTLGSGNPVSMAKPGNAATHGVRLFQHKVSGSWDPTLFKLGYRNSGDEDVTAFSDVPSTAWSFVAAAVDATGNTVLCLNGSLDSITANNPPQWSVFDRALAVGMGRNFGGLGQHWRGKLGPLFLWSRALGIGEIQQVYRNPFVMFDSPIGRSQTRSLIQRQYRFMRSRR